MHTKEMQNNTGFQNDLDARGLELAANTLKAIAHPMRMAILYLLKREGRMSVTQIYGALGLEQAVASHHLGILKDKGVLGSSREGKNTFYYLGKPELAQVLDIVQQSLR
ncbi:MAG: metalloregulator ArsR/SmtB family transcription factor [Bacteroidetes bacterium]|jgi:DNA-binding transcriptional ArsR family regulator|nr:metalloregulator ArsR/SmtB family transcription factor [Bacteroidota bacterium]